MLVTSLNEEQFTNTRVFMKVVSKVPIESNIELEEGEIDDPESKAEDNKKKVQF